MHYHVSQFNVIYNNGSGSIALAVLLAPALNVNQCMHEEESQ